MILVRRLDGNVLLRKRDPFVSTVHRFKQLLKTQSRSGDFLYSFLDSVNFLDDVLDLGLGRVLALKILT